MSSFPVLPLPAQKSGPSMSTWMADLVKRWPSMSDAEKLQYVTEAGEMVGGTVGAAMGGGYASIPAAGAGAMVGNDLANIVAPAIGIKRPTPTGMERMGELAKTFAVNAAGEGIFGKAIPAASAALPRSVKQLPLRVAGASPAAIDAVQPSTAATAVKNYIRNLSQPTKEAQVIQKLADKYGVTLDLGQSTGLPLYQMMGNLMARSPWSSNKIMGSRQAQYKQFENAIEKYLDSYHKGQVSLEDFARLADETMSSAKNSFNERVASGAAAAGKQLSPVPVSDVQTGRALQAGRKANVDAVQSWSRKAYGDIDAKYGDIEVDMMPLGVKSREVLREELAPGKLREVFPSSAVDLLESTNLKPSSENVPLAERMYAEMNNLPTPVGERTPPTVSLKQAMNARSELLKTASSIQDPKYQRQAYLLAEAIDDSIRESLGKTPGAEKVYGKIKAVNDQYRKYMERTRAPRTDGSPGNPISEDIHKSTFPEDLPSSVTKTPTRTEMAVDVTRPGMVPSVEYPGGDPVQQLRRNRFDATLKEATVSDPATGSSRISPTSFSDALPEQGTAEALYGRQLPQVAGIGKPNLVNRERFLYNSPVGMPRENSKSYFNAVFPPNSSGKELDQTMQFFQDAGRKPETQRAFGQQLFAKSETEIPSIGDDRYTNPRRLEKQITEYGETIPRVLGEQAPSQIKEYVDLGKGLTEAEHRFGNPSGTGRIMHAFQTVKDLLPTPDNLKNATAAKVWMQAKSALMTANRYNDPSKYGWMLEKPEKLLGVQHNPVLGAAGRYADLPPKPEADVAESPDFGEAVDIGSVAASPATEESPDFGEVVDIATVTAKPKPKRNP